MRRYLGKYEGGKGYVEWHLKDGEFTAQGELWRPSGRDIDMGGQCLDKLLELFPDDEYLPRIVKVWEHWHLNHMRAGCEHQRAEGWDKRPIDPSKPLRAYGKHFEGQYQSSWNMLAWVSRAEHPEGLLSHPCSVCGYKYGTRWLKEEIPEDVLAEIASWKENV